MITAAGEVRAVDGEASCSQDIDIALIVGGCMPGTVDKGHCRK